MLVAAASPASAATPTSKDPFVKQILDLTNQYRADHGLTPVVWNQKIAAVSQQWADTLNNRINRNTFEMSTVHRHDAGRSVIPRNYDWYSEIIAINNTAQQTVTWWMNSPAHRAAMLDPDATDVGVGYVKTTRAGWAGMYVVAENLAGYPDTRETLPPAAPVNTAVLAAGDIAGVDGHGYLYVYASARGGDLWNRKYISYGWRNVQQLEVADWNADGLQDLVAVWKNGKLTVSYGLPNGKLAPIRAIGSSGWAGYDINVSNWKSADAYPAVVARNKANGRLYYYKNSSGASLHNRVRIGTGWKNLDIFSLDYDGDGRQDLVARTSRGQLKLYRGNGVGTFASESRRIVGRSGWNAMNHLSAITNHLGDGQDGILARSTTGNLYYYPVTQNRINRRITIGVGGWNTLKVGS